MPNRRHNATTQELQGKPERLSFLYGLAPVGYVSTDRRDVVREVTGCLGAMLGLQHHEVVGRRLCSFLAPASRSAYHAHRRSILAGRGPQACDAALRRRDGRAVDVHIRMTSSESPSGRVAGCESALMVIGEPRNRAAVTAAAAPDIAHALRLDMVSQMAGSLAHDVAQPLVAIENLAAACLNRLRDVNDVAVQQALAEIQEQSVRASSLVHGVRRYMVKRAMTREAGDLNEIVQQALRILHGEARDRGVDVRLELAPGPLPVHIDSVQVQQVLLNLARNAIDATVDTRKGRRTVCVRTSKVAGDRVAVEVCDRGRRPRGVRYEDLFRSFFTTKREGMGLGLAISRTLAELHGGELVGGPRAGGGSTFRLTLRSKKGRRRGAPRPT